ncbi:hypothetical protein BKA56DRAFT_703549 [Ilyonectria sp. MPI-CAGE-AT-0026]|nr:hypothetical protein BKA56DRAFT_703549 [Ilyonectria sp. MPI-CAGE-AT-0026]
MRAKRVLRLADVRISQLFLPHFSNWSQPENSDRNEQDNREPKPSCNIPQRLAHTFKYKRAGYKPNNHRPKPTMDTKGQTPDPIIQDGCIQAVTALFPDICLAYLATVAAPLLYDPDAVINHIIDLNDKGTSYTRRPLPNTLKRKRADDDEDEVFDAKRKYCSSLRTEIARSNQEMTMMRKLITGDFPLVHSKDVQKLLTQHGLNLVPTYLALSEIVREGDQAAEPWKKKKRPTVQEAQYRPENIDDTIEKCNDGAEKKMLREVRAARLIQASLDMRKRKHLRVKEAGMKDYEEAKSHCQLMDCQCCFAEFPRNRLVSCNAASSHWFCVDCTRRNAETLVGLSKYELTCMSTDGCEAGFSHAQRGEFLDKKLISALDRIEQEAVLRMAAIENLATCPFCPYAAEYPPVELNQEFHCANPTCRMISCRLCQAETHVPKTCEEAALEHGIPARRDIEEAMTAAMIRKCNKCSTPFIKESGCNKMRCTRKGCGNTQCYVCSKSCDYSHFNDPNQGGKSGNCPMFDVTENRHLEEVKNAEAEARKLVAEKNPDVNPELLEIKMSDKVTEDDARRRQDDPFVNQRVLYMNGALIPDNVPAAAALPMARIRRQAQANDQGGLLMPEGIFVYAQVLNDRVAGVRAAERWQAAQAAQVERAQLRVAHAHALVALNEIVRRPRPEVQAELDQLVDDFGHMMGRAGQDLQQERMLIAQQQQQQQQQHQAQQEHNRRPGHLARQLEINHQPGQNPQPPRPQGQPARMQHGPLTRQMQQQQLQRLEVQVQRLREVQRRKIEEQRQAAQQVMQRPMQRHAEQQMMQEQQQQHQQRQQQAQQQAQQQQQQRQQQAGIANPNRNKNVVPVAKDAAQGEQPQPAQGVARVQGWLNHLHTMDVGFGPLQGMDFGRALASNNLVGELRGMQGNQNAVAGGQWAQHPDYEDLQVMFGNRKMPFGARYGALGRP